MNYIHRTLHFIIAAAIIAGTFKDAMASMMAKGHSKVVLFPFVGGLAILLTVFLSRGKKIPGSLIGLFGVLLVSITFIPSVVQAINSIISRPDGLKINYIMMSVFIGLYLYVLLASVFWIKTDSTKLKNSLK